MDCRVADLRYKEIIDVSDGTRYGYVSDVELDTSSGQIQALVIYGRLRLFGLLGREEDLVFPWSAVKRFGEDIILVESDGCLAARTRRSGGSGRERKGFF